MGLKLVFMGTPLFAKHMLQGLYQSQHDVLAVVTVADKPAGRGQKIQDSEVKRLAQEHGTPILQPLSLKDPYFIAQLASFQADLFVVVAFRMLPEIVWKMPPKGTINLHASLLPNYRGAAPIHWAVIKGEKKTGLSTFFSSMKKSIVDPSYCKKNLRLKTIGPRESFMTQCSILDVN